MRGIIGYLSPLFFFRHIWRHRHIVWLLSVREVTGKYKGTFMGMTWTLLEPLLMLGVYTFVFSVIFKGNWSGVAESGITGTAPILFMGLITFGLFSDAVVQAPSIILRNRNFVKKVVFPLEMLPVVGLSSVLIRALSSLIVLLIGLLVVYHSIPPTVLLLPLAWIPMLFLSLGISYFFASFGVFIRDLGAAIGIAVLMLRFLTPVFYPATMVPPFLRPWFMVNPLAIFVNCSRRLVLWGMYPDWQFYVGGTLVAFIVLMAGFAWFMASKRAFADVI